MRLQQNLSLLINACNCVGNFRSHCKRILNPGTADGVQKCLTPIAFYISSKPVAQSS